ncbi:histidine kinase sensor domain-containing protein [Vibrio navarrensis]
MAKLRRWLGLPQKLAVRLFVALALGVVLVVSAFSCVEMLLYQRLLNLSKQQHQEFVDLAHQAAQWVSRKEWTQLAQWEAKQSYVLYVVDQHFHPVSGRDVHPHVLKKMHFYRRLDQPMGDRVSRPMIGIRLDQEHQLMIQLPWQQHPAAKASYYLWAANAIVGVCILAFISWVLTRYLQNPLTQLQSATRALAQEKTDTRVAHTLGHSVSEFRELALDFDRMAERIQTLVEEQRQLVRTLSHELKTPLTRQLLATHLCQRAKEPEQRTLWLNRVEQEAQLMNSMIEKILELSQLESSQFSVSLKPLDVNAYLTEQAALFEPHLLPGQRIELALCQQAAWIEADPVLLGSALNNLLTNCVKYAGEACTICLSTSVEQEVLVIEVADDGPGVGEQELAKLFTPFYQVKQSPSSASGYGLGLSIVAQAVKKMAGSLSAHSENGLQVRLQFACWQQAAKSSVK